MGIQNRVKNENKETILDIVNIPGQWEKTSKIMLHRQNSVG